MLLLAFDTATPAVTVAVCDGDLTLAEHTVVDARRHGELLAPGIRTVLDTAGITRQQLAGIAVGVGPGPFTGLRVGLVTARVLGATLDIPVFGVCTLDGLAELAGRTGEYGVATDARRKEVYWARYAGPDRLDGPQVSRPDDAGKALASLPVVGAGAALYPDAFPDSCEPQLPVAAALASWVTAGRPTLPPLPLYLRRPDAVAPGPPKRVSPR
ncbi:MAG: tRNA (adenosine(37)-N6)-threonylcarbamoyltransferase complex dimerization subunit type 1 TsaB [Sporichthyaceae bacterium]|nr:tRNA (adenosine(37)-N6)-threonylcarbamoyltransferase complex dimerization subunit type 1 TsaB [Sporichthyaceae bacterium]